VLHFRGLDALFGFQKFAKDTNCLSIAACKKVHILVSFGGLQQSGVLQLPTNIKAIMPIIFSVTL
jgi:hypothetical protein